MGLMVSILVFLYVIDETSYEKHIADYQDIYRMGINASLMGQTMDAPVHPVVRWLNLYGQILLK